MTRRTALFSLSAAAAAPSSAASATKAPTPVEAFVRRNDEIVQSYFERQNTNPDSRWRGSVPDAYGLHEPGAASGVIVRGIASYCHEKSRYFRDDELRRRIEMAIEHLLRVQTPDGNFDLLITNFNSPPDTGFIVLNLGLAAELARLQEEDALFAKMERLLRNCGRGLLAGGIHTPNHRWVVSAALAHLYEIFGDDDYTQRAEQWLAEGIDIDSDGQYSEQSTTVYNAITNDALVTIAAKLDKPELFEPVRRNLDAMLYLLHPGYEVVTAISQRQDRNVVGDMGRYWYSLRYMARRDGNGRFETLARAFEPRHGSLADLMTAPTLAAEGPEPKPLPDNYEKRFPQSHLVHIRRGPTSASLIVKGNSRFFAVRRGEAVVNGVRFAAAFFGKGQFVPKQSSRHDGAYRLEQSLEAAYYQPFGDERRQPWGVGSWYKLRSEREATEINRIRYAAEIKEREDGFDVRILAEGVDWVPLAVEINLREDGDLYDVTETERDDVFLLESGYALYRRGGDAIRFGPGLAETQYTQVRGALEKLPGPSVYLTGYTPFDHTLEFRW